MSHLTRKIIGSHIPLWKRKIPKYPVHWHGDPQLRVFLPMFWMKLLKPKDKIPENRVHFEVHPQMSKIDVKNYLEKIYKVPVLEVRVSVHIGEDIKHPTRGHTIAKENDKKLAYVLLGEGQTFKFPAISDKPSDADKQMEDYAKMSRSNERVKQKYWDKVSLPPWFR